MSYKDYNEIREWKLEYNILYLEGIINICEISYLKIVSFYLDVYFVRSLSWYC